MMSDERLVCDGWNLIEVLDAAGTPQQKYTWGLDLSGLSGNATAERIVIWGRSSFGH